MKRTYINPCTISLDLNVQEMLMTLSDRATLNETAATVNGSNELSNETKQYNTTTVNWENW